MNWFISAVRKASYVSTGRFREYKKNVIIAGGVAERNSSFLGGRGNQTHNLLDKITNDLTTDCTKMTEKSAPGCWFCLVLYYVRIFLCFRNSAACIYSR